MSVVVYFESHEINEGVSQGSLFGLALFLLFINDLPRNIFRSLVNLCVDDTTSYGGTSKIRRNWLIT